MHKSSASHSQLFSIQTNPPTNTAQRKGSSDFRNLMSKYNKLLKNVKGDKNRLPQADPAISIKDQQAPSLSRLPPFRKFSLTSLFKKRDNPQFASQSQKGLSLHRHIITTQQSPQQSSGVSASRKFKLRQQRQVTPTPATPFANNSDSLSDVSNAVSNNTAPTKPLAATNMQNYNKAKMQMLGTDSISIEEQSLGQSLGESLSIQKFFSDKNNESLPNLVREIYFKTSGQPDRRLLQCQSHDNLLANQGKLSPRLKSSKTMNKMFRVIERPRNKMLDYEDLSNKPMYVLPAIVPTTAHSRKRITFSIKNTHTEQLR